MMARELEGRFSLLLDEQEKISQKSPYASLVRLNIGDIKSRNFHFTLASWVVALTVYINMMKAHLGKMQSFLSDLLKCQDRELLEDVVEQNILFLRKEIILATIVLIDLETLQKIYRTLKG